MRAKLGTAFMVSLALAVCACGSHDKASTSPSPSPSVAISTRPPTPYITPAPVTPTVVTTERPISSTTFKPQSELLSDLASNRAKWDAAGIQNYQYGFTLRCFCYYQNQPTMMVVRNGKLVSMSDSGGALITPGTEYGEFLRYSTVDLTFQQMETEIPESTGVVVTYDEENGFPTEILIGARGYGTDSGSDVTISNFEVLQ